MRKRMRKRMNRAGESRIVAGEAISADNRHIVPIYKIESSVFRRSFLAELKPKGILDVERDGVFYIPVDDDEVSLDELFDDVPGLEDLISGLKNSLQA
ncbi:MAG: hypothetical protein R6U44_08595 [Archaeoglobaceae archaeon]